MDPEELSPVAENAYPLVASPVVVSPVEEAVLPSAVAPPVEISDCNCLKIN